MKATRIINKTEHVSVVLLGIVALTVCWFEPVSASSDVTRLKGQAFRTLCEASPPVNIAYLAAANDFHQVASSRPDDIDAIYYQAIALNRLRLYKPAVKLFKKVRQLGADYPELSLELGWSLVGLGQGASAIKELENYALAQPNDVLNIRLLAHAYYFIGDLNRVDAELKRLVHLAPKMKVAVKSIRGYIATDKNWLEPTPSLKAVCANDAVTDSHFSDSKQRQGGFNAQLSVGGGYNSNVMGLASNLALPTHTPHEDSAFFETQAGASYQKYITDNDLLTVGYGFQAKVYGENALSKNFDLMDHLMTANYQHLLSKDVTLGIRLSDEFTQLGGNSLRNQFVLRPALSYRVTDWLAAEVAYKFTNDDFFFNAAAIRDRDNTAQGMDLTTFFQWPELGLRGRLGYQYNSVNADGRDFYYHTNAIVAGIGHTFAGNITADVYYTRSFNDYDHANSLSSKGFKRDDDIDQISLQLGIPIMGPISAYVHYDYLSVDSNISFYNFNKHTASAGFAINF